MDNNANQLYHGDNLSILREMPAGCIDLIYADPPFNTGNTQNSSSLPWRTPLDAEYEDSFVEMGDYSNDKSISLERQQEWHEKYKHHEFYFLHHICSTTELYYYFHFIPLVYEIKRVLKYGGALYWHIDYRTSHIWRIIISKIFGDKRAFNSEIIWHYPNKTSHFAIKYRYALNHNTILFYARFTQSKEESRHSLELEYERGTRIKQRTVWTIEYCKQSERVGYPTQKPLALLARIIKASSKEGDVVLDPFCGSGTTLRAAKTLGRKYIGIDQNPEAIRITENRLNPPQQELFTA